MKYLDKLMELGCFSRRDVVEVIGNEKATHSLLHRYIKAGYIQRIRRDLYSAISFETKQPVANRFQIATFIADDACVSYHSAFEYYGYANQVYYEVYVTSSSRFSDFYYDGISYTRVSPRINSGIITTKTGIRITDLERTVIDSIHGFENIGGLEELLRCLALIPSLQSDKLANYLDDYGLAGLYQKAGYILSYFPAQLDMPEFFLDYCRSNLPQSKKYFYSEKDSLSRHFVFHRDWMLFAPPNLKSLINKGVDLNG